MQSISTFEEKERLHEVVITKYSLYEGKFSRMRRFLLKPACFRGILSETTQQGIDSSELKPLDVSWLLMPQAPRLFKDARAATTKNNIFYLLRSKLMTLRLFSLQSKDTGLHKARKERLISLSPGSNTSYAV